eukprot:960711-Pyramimonas_sp.AAC.1
MVISPGRAVILPVRMVISAGRAVTSPVRAKISAVRAVTSPVRAVFSPVRAVTSPVRAVFSPVRAVISAVKVVISAVRAVISPIIAVAGGRPGLTFFARLAVHLTVTIVSLFWRAGQLSVTIVSLFWRAGQLSVTIVSLFWRAVQLVDAVVVAGQGTQDPALGNGHLAHFLEDTRRLMWPSAVSPAAAAAIAAALGERSRCASIPVSSKDLGVRYARAPRGC